MFNTTEVRSPKEWKKELSNALKNFLKHNKQFNVKGRWTGKDGVTVNVLADFGIEDRDLGGYYVASVWANYEDNIEWMYEKGDYTEENPRQQVIREMKEKLVESDTLIEAENNLIRAVKKVLKVPYGVRPSKEFSDIGVGTTMPISWESWDWRVEPEKPRRR